MPVLLNSTSNSYCRNFVLKGLVSAGWSGARPRPDCSVVTGWQGRQGLLF